MGAQDDEGPESPSVIVTRRLWLKLPDDDQAAAAEALAASPAVARDIVARGQRVVVGSAGYAAIADRPSAAEMALWIGEPHWGRGYGTEAAQGLIDRVFANPRIDVLWCSNRVINDRARRVVEKCGFQPRGNGMVRSPSLRGAYPVERFLLDRRNWASLKAWGAIVRPEEEEDGQRDNAA
jgi:RimJ/RimL family protein N-acetyltransferase